jgi:hypothetical protein
LSATTISVVSPVFPAWTRISAPTVEHPYWHEHDDKTPHTLREITATLPPERVAEIQHLHANAIAEIASAAMGALNQSDEVSARRLSHCAARLCQEICGLWPISGRRNGA